MIQDTASGGGLRIIKHFIIVSLPRLPEVRSRLERHESQRNN
jgi:hypothetical protein